MNLDEETILNWIDFLNNTICHNSSKFFKVDFHVHTLHSHDVKSKLSVDEYADGLMQIARNQGLDIIAITDHNCIKDFEIFEKKGKKNNIVVLPGVEINVPKSLSDPSRHPIIHIIALHKTPAMINSILRTLNIEEECDTKTVVANSEYLGLEGVLKTINNKGGIAILAHSSSKRGFGNEFRNSYRTTIAKRIKEIPFFVEVRSNIDAKFFDGSDEGLDYLYRPCIYGSDCHTIENESTDSRKLGSRYTYLKIQNSEYHNILKVLREPKLRVSREEPTKFPNQKILGMVITGGYFKDEKIPFHPNLNVIIGGRGAGKSTLLSLIQFAFNDTPLTLDGKMDHELKIHNLLKSGNVVYLFFYGNDEKLYLLKRTYVEDIQDTAHMKLYSIQDNKLINEEINKLEQIAELEIYRQGELVEISKRAFDQLRLIDDYIENKEIFEKRNEICSSIIAKTQDIYTIMDKIQELEEKISKKGIIQEKINELSHLVEFNFVKNYQAWQTEANFIQEIEDFLAKMTKSVYSIPFPTEVEIEDKNKINHDLIDPILEKCSKLQKETFERARELINCDYYTKLHKDIGELIENWRKLFSKVKLEYEANLDTATYDIDAIVETLERRKEEKRKIEKNFEPKLDEYFVEITARENIITQRFRALKKIDNKIQKERTEVIKYISKNLPNVAISFKKTRTIDSIIEKLSTRFTGKEYRISRKEEKFRKIFQNINNSPIDLFELLLNEEKYDELISKDIDKRVFYILQEHRFDEGFLSSLIEEAPFLPEIKLRKSEEDLILLEELSLGEKCGTILSIILLQKSKPRILIIDTPESELDHNYFITNVIETIGKAKYGTQLIFVTHNPNIPVLADAELILEITAIGLEKGNLSKLGYLDDDCVLEAVLSLEGGEEAFKSRSRRYGFSLN